MNLLLLFFLFFLGGCSIHVSSSITEQLGISFYGNPFQVVNSSPFYCRLIIGNKEMGILTPGSLVYDERYWHNQPIQHFAVVALCYSDSALTHYFGAAGCLMTLNGYNVAEWTIRSSDIRTPDGRPLRIPSAPTTAVAPTSQRIKLPREWWASSTGIQVVNNTVEDVKIFVNGRLVAVIGTGGVDYIRAELIGGYARPIIITITNELRCTYT